MGKFYLGRSLLHALFLIFAGFITAGLMFLSFWWLRNDQSLMVFGAACLGFSYGALVCLELYFIRGSGRGRDGLGRLFIPGLIEGGIAFFSFFVAAGFFLIIAPGTGELSPAQKMAVPLCFLTTDLIFAFVAYSLFGKRRF